MRILSRFGTSSHPRYLCPGDFSGNDLTLPKLRVLNAPTPGDGGGNGDIAARTHPSLVFDDLCDSMNLDRPWCPGLSRLEIVDNKSHLPLACHNIFVFARGLN